MSSSNVPQDSWGYTVGIPPNMLDVSQISLEDNNLKPLNMDGMILQCRVTQVYDGDSITLIAPFYGVPFIVKCRLMGIDSAEVRSKDPLEKAYALETREYVKKRIEGAMVWVECLKMDKYGRLLGYIYQTSDCSDRTASLNNHLVDSGLAYFYEGKTKRSFKEWCSNEGVCVVPQYRENGEDFN